MTASLTCPHCGWTSQNPTDARERYCGRCHVFLDDEAALLDLMTAEMSRCETPIDMVLRPSSALQLAALLQLALRHPDVDGRSAGTAVTFIEHVREYFRSQDAPAVVEVLRRGDAQ